MFEDFEEYLTNLDKAQKTIAGYLRDMRLFAEWFQQTNSEPLSPQALTKIDARQYRQHLLNEKARPATINRKLAALRAYSDWAKASGQVEYSLVNGIKNVAEQKHAPKWLNKKEQAALEREAEKLLSTAKTVPAIRQAKRDYAIVVMLLNTGLRISELCDLDVGDVDTGDRKGEVRVRHGKGSKARTIPLNKLTRRVVKEWLDKRPECKSEALFVSKFGDRMATRVVQSMVEELGRRADVDASPHTLRHSFAKNLVDNGVSLEKVAALLGHSNLNTTAVYTTPSGADLENAVETLSD